MPSTLDGFVSDLRDQKPLREEQIDELQRAAQILMDHGWSGSIPMDEAIDALAEQEWHKDSGH